MNKEVVNTGLLAASFLGLFGIAELLYHTFKVRAELTRKLVHVGTGFLTLLFPVLLCNQWLVLLLCATFACIILASLQFNFLRSINGIDRKSHGSISYPIAVYGCYLVYHYYSGRGTMQPHPYLYFYLPILTLAICDPVAALVGKTYPYGKFTIMNNTKTLVGTVAFMVSSVILTLCLFHVLAVTDIPGIGKMPFVLLTALMAAGAEAISGNGVDNITIPATVVVLLILFA